MLRALAGLCTVLCVMSFAHAKPPAALPLPALLPGVPLELAQWRSRHYADIRYGLDVELRKGADRLLGRMELRVKVARDAAGRVPDLILDWRATSPLARLGEISANGRSVEPRIENEHLVIGRSFLRAGENVIRLRFEAPVAVAGTAVTRYLDREDGSEYLYTLFVPSDASTVFPCFDQPDLKARFSLSLTLPEGWTAVANTAETARAAQRIAFAPTEPLSTYLFAFAAGPFGTITEAGDPTRLFVRRSRLERARHESADVLRLNRAAVQYFARYFGHRFPFAKYDLVLLPEFPFGGMEHAGTTFLNELAVLFPSEPSETDRLRRAQLIFHETSHQWFGDLVTMRWFDDLWLKEGFANFMAAKAAAELTNFEAWSAFHALKTSAYRTDVTRGTTPIYRPIGNLSAAKSAYGAIVYSKAPAILRQAEFYLGAPVFERAVRDFVKRHAYKAADWSDLVRSFERASGRDLRGWADAWVKRRGLPEVRLNWTLDAQGRIRTLGINQVDALAEGGLWPMRLEVAATDAEGVTRLGKVQLRGRSAQVRSFAGTPAPVWAYANFGDYGYGRFLLDARSRETLLGMPARAPAVRSSATQPAMENLLRAQQIEALWEAVRDAELAPAQFIGYATAVAQGGDLDEVTLAGLLARIDTAFRRYLSDAQRNEAAQPVERLLIDGMLRAATMSRRITYLRAFTNLAWTPAAQAELKRLLDGSLEVPGVKLSSRDRFRIIARLLVRGDAEAHQRVAAQAAADRSDDGKRYAFAAGAADPDAGAKRALFELFLRDAQLAESWIEEALGPLNSVEHAASTAPLLPRALAELPRLKKTRKIFFVNHWLAAFIGGQTDSSSLAAVREFLREPGLDEDLRLKVLENLDSLERTVGIAARYAR